MGTTLLASVVTIYVSGLALIVPSGKPDGQADILLLRDNKFPKRHRTAKEGKLVRARIGEHNAYLVVAADALAAGSTGYELLGGPGPDQIARFPLSGKGRVTGTSDTTFDVDGELARIIPSIGYKAGVCGAPTQVLKRDWGKWPVKGQLHLSGIRAARGHGGAARMYFKGGDHCPTQESVHEVVAIDIEVAGSVAVEWEQGRMAHLKSAAKSLAVWNLPKEAHPMDLPHQGLHEASLHFDAYHSLLEARGDCLCELSHIDHGGSGGARPFAASKPVFCPPARAKR